MVSFETIMITSVIETQKGRYVAAIDIPQAYLNKESDEEVIMTLKTILSEILVNI